MYLPSIINEHVPILTSLRNCDAHITHPNIINIYKTETFHWLLYTCTINQRNKAYFYMFTLNDG
jgi:hypothetical protein